LLIDVANPLDFSRGMPPTLSVCNTDSLGEQIQRALPALKVVKALNTTNASVMANPAAVGDGNHTLFVCGNDADAKARVTELVRSFGWRDVVDVGDITAARGTEMLLPLWLRLYGAFKTPLFNFKVVVRSHGGGCAPPRFEPPKVRSRSSSATFPIPEPAWSGSRCRPPGSATATP
jgi:predicted dinucleotide-binding enzyme